MKTSVCFVLLCSMLFFFNTAKSQHFSGNWDGFVYYINADGVEYSMPYKMLIIQTDDGYCYGQSLLIDDGFEEPVSAKYNFEGSCNGSTMQFEENKLVDAQYPDDDGFFWCQKSGTIYLEGSTIKGSLNGYSPNGSCPPVRVLLNYHSPVN